MDHKCFAIVYRKIEAIHGRNDISDLEIERAFNRYKKIQEG